MTKNTMVDEIKAQIKLTFDDEWFEEINADNFSDEDRDEALSIHAQLMEAAIAALELEATNIKSK